MVLTNTTFQITTGWIEDLEDAAGMRRGCVDNEIMRRTDQESLHIDLHSEGAVLCTINREVKDERLAQESGCLKTRA